MRDVRTKPTDNATTSATQERSPTKGHQFGPQCDKMVEVSVSVKQLAVATSNRMFIWDWRLVAGNITTDDPTQTKMFFSAFFFRVAGLLLTSNLGADASALMFPTVTSVGAGQHRPDSWSGSGLWRLWSQWVISISPLTHSPWPRDPCSDPQTAGPWFWFHY